MNQIPLQDKEKIVNGLAQGQSYSQAMEGTAIKSKDTVHRIAKQETNAIERKRAQYLKKIKQMGASDTRRAQMWSRMTVATKRVGKELLEMPDWQSRSIALKYIDNMAGLSSEEELKVEINNTMTAQSPDLRSTEVLDFNKDFEKFLESQSNN